MSASCFCCSANGSVIVVAFARRKRGKTNFPPMVSIQSCVGISIGRERFLRTTKITVQLASALNVINYAVKQKRKKKQTLQMQCSAHFAKAADAFFDE